MSLDRCVTHVLDSYNPDAAPAVAGALRCSASRGSADRPRPCGAPSGFYPRSLRYSVRHSGKVNSASSGVGATWMMVCWRIAVPRPVRPEGRATTGVDRRGFDLSPYGSPSTGALWGQSPKGAPQGCGASIVRPGKACRSTSPQRPRAQGTPKGRDIRVSFLWLLSLDKQRK
jgi:hypothetical protein